MTNSFKIQIYYSQPFDRLLTLYEGKQYTKNQEEEIKKYIKLFQEKWGKVHPQIIETLEEVTKTKFKTKEIKCYVVEYCLFNGLSEPLTIRMEKDLDYAISTLIHELVHILTKENSEKFDKITNFIKKEFPKEAPRTQRHILVCLIQHEVLKRLFDKKFIKKILEKESTYRRLKKAWELILSGQLKLKDLPLS